MISGCMWIPFIMKCYNVAGKHVLGVDFPFAEIGTCKCFGDPHCLSFDRRWNHYQGPCDYLMAQDGCLNGVPNGIPTFEVFQSNSRLEMLTEVTWVREVLIKVYNTVCATRREYQSPLLSSHTFLFLVLFRKLRKITTWSCLNWTIGKSN